MQFVLQTACEKPLNFGSLAIIDYSNFIKYVYDPFANHPMYTNFNTLLMEQNVLDIKLYIDIH